MSERGKMSCAQKELILLCGLYREFGRNRQMKLKTFPVRFFFEAHPINVRCDLRSLISFICTICSGGIVMCNLMFAMGFEICVGTFQCRCSVFTTNSMYFPHKAYHGISYLTSKSTNLKHKQLNKYLRCSPSNHHNALLMNNSSADFHTYLYAYFHTHVCMYIHVTRLSHQN